MAIKLTQGLRQSQNLLMTPQLQQAIKLLTLTHLEMSDMIAAEMVENPMLEEIDGDSGAQTDTAAEENLAATFSTFSTFTTWCAAFATTKTTAAALAPSWAFTALTARFETCVHIISPYAAAS